jgi:hypothetical protein
LLAFSAAARGHAANRNQIQIRRGNVAPSAPKEGCDVSHSNYLPERMGTAAISPTGKFEAGSFQSFTLVYTAGYFGIDDTGSIKIVHRFASDMGRPQWNDPKAANIHIPVDFQNPTDEDFTRFRSTMEQLKEVPVHVHCIANYRVSAFLYRYRRDVLGTNEAQARAKHVVKTGKTPVLEGAEWRKLLNSIPATTLRDLRDRALIATLTYSFARISAA